MIKFTKMFATTASVVMAGTLISVANPQTASAVKLGVSFQNTACNLNVLSSNINCSSAPPLKVDGTVDVDISNSPFLTDFSLNVLAPALSSQAYNLSKSDLDNLVSSGAITYSYNVNNISANNDFSVWKFNLSGNIYPSDGDIGSIGIQSPGLSFNIDASSDKIDTITIFGNALLPQVLPTDLLTLVPSNANPIEVEQFVAQLPKAPNPLPFSLLLSGDWEVSVVDQPTANKTVPESSTLFGTAILGVAGLLIKRKKGKKLADVQAAS